MAVVKGSKQDRLSLIRYDPWHRFLRGVYFLLFTVFVAAGCFFGGQYASLEQVNTLSKERDQLQEQIIAADQEIRRTRQTDRGDVAEGKDRCRDRWRHR